LDAFPKTFLKKPIDGSCRPSRAKLKAQRGHYKRFEPEMQPLVYDKNGLHKTLSTKAVSPYPQERGDEVLVVVLGT
jgi:hypothetical protein